MESRRYTVRLGSELYIPDVEGRPERKILISPLKWREIDYQGSDPVLWAVELLRELENRENIPFGEAMDGAHLEAVLPSEWPGEDWRVDYAKFDGDWTDSQLAEVLASFPAY